MKIKIRKNALQLYIQDNTDFSGYYFGEDRWELIFKKISGKTLEVDTEELFKYEFNLKPIKGVTKYEIRIFDDYVEKVYEDERSGKARCELCSRTSSSDHVCSHCGRSDYLEPFEDEIIEDYYVW